MSDKPNEEMTDKGIADLVSFVETCELLASAMGVSASVAARWLLKSAQLMKNRDNPLFNAPMAPGKPS